MRLKGGLKRRVRHRKNKEANCVFTRPVLLLGVLRVGSFIRTQTQAKSRAVQISSISSSDNNFLAFISVNLKALRKLFVSIFPISLWSSQNWTRNWTWVLGLVKCWCQGLGQALSLGSLAVGYLVCSLPGVLPPCSWQGTKGRTLGMGIMLELLSQFAHFWGLGRRLKRAAFVQQGFLVAGLMALRKQASLVNDCLYIVTALRGWWVKISPESIVIRWSPVTGPESLFRRAVRKPS